MASPAWGTVPIKCGRRSCDWTGLETDLIQVPDKRWQDVTKGTCPKCGCDGYRFSDAIGSGSAIKEDV